MNTPNLDHMLSTVPHDSELWTRARLEVEQMRLALATLRSSQPAWVRVTERLPDTLLDDYLVIDVDGNHHIACYESSLASWVGDNGCVNVTHWQPLPLSPPSGNAEEA